MIVALLVEDFEAAQEAEAKLAPSAVALMAQEIDPVDFARKIGIRRGADGGFVYDCSCGVTHSVADVAAAEDVPQEVVELFAAAAATLD
jgi:hypothetical protein